MEDGMRQWRSDGCDTMEMEDGMGCYRERMERQLTPLVNTNLQINTRTYCSYGNYANKQQMQSSVSGSACYYYILPELCIELSALTGFLSSLVVATFTPNTTALLPLVVCISSS